MNPRILIAGDSHGDFHTLIRAVRKHRPAAVISVGDLQPQRPLQEELAPILELTEFWYVHGNHDTDSEADFSNLWGSALAQRNLDGRVVEIAGVRVAGLGGVFRGRAWMPPAKPTFESLDAFLRAHDTARPGHENLPRIHRSTIFPEVYHRLGRERAEVLVTHEAPSAHPHGFEAIDLLAAAIGATRVFHGHHHDSLDYSAFNAESPFRAFGVGLRGISDLDGTRIVAGEKGAERAERVRRRWG